MIERNNLPLTKGQLGGLTSMKHHFSVIMDNGKVCCQTTTKFNMETKETPNQPSEKPASKKKLQARKDQCFDCLEVESEDTLQESADIKPSLLGLGLISADVKKGSARGCANCFGWCHIFYDGPMSPVQRLAGWLPKKTDHLSKQQQLID
ncbi:hypothetical protein [uncultured Marinobacter sp.]|uniref:hypothetical protein n=1 Tax=uncultured Marinobacter sp. TaxID=187379 RepID=UPI0025980EEF|nr:hypothetical protein [uncultured Marinobacter sp.]